MTSRYITPGDHEPPASRGAELFPSQEMLAQLQRKIESLPTIEQAKGILMARFNLDADTAFALLVRWSQTNNLKLRSVSTALADAAGTPGALDELIDRLQKRTATAEEVRR